LGSKDFSLYLGQLQNASNGFMAFITVDNTTYIRISEFGSKFIDFISNSSLERIKEMAE